MGYAFFFAVKDGQFVGECCPRCDSELRIRRPFGETWVVFCGCGFEQSSKDFAKDARYRMSIAEMPSEQRTGYALSTSRLTFGANEARRSVRAMAKHCKAEGV